MPTTDPTQPVSPLKVRLLQLVLGIVLVAIGAIGARLGVDPATTKAVQEGVRAEGAAVVSQLTAPAPE